jgi:hypothetical protein
MRHSTSILCLALAALGACAPGPDPARPEDSPAAPGGAGSPGLSADPQQSPEFGDTKKRTDVLPALERRVEVFDGASSASYWLSEVLIVETRADEQGMQLVLATAPGATVAHDGGYNRVWRLPAGTTPDAVLAQLRLGDPSRSFSHVFHRGSSGDTPYVAFPGGVFVTLDPALGDDGSQAWLGGKGLVVERKLPIQGNVYHVRSGPGLEALALAEELRREPPVVATALNAWEPLALR